MHHHDNFFSKLRWFRHHHHAPHHACRATWQLPLIELEENDTGIVEQICGGREVVKRLLALGVAPGIRFLVKNKYHHGPIIIYINDTKIAIGRGEACRIFVRLTPVVEKE